MDPNKYLRPTAPVSEGNVARAEKLIESLGLQRSLERRFAKLEEITALWKPRVEEPKPAGGVFGHLLGSGDAARDLGTSANKITWVKFESTVLPTAERIEVNAPVHGTYVGFVTAVHPDAPPILQWDRPDRRNTVSWYLYTDGSSSRRWGLSPGFVDVTAICLAPSHWNGESREKDGHRVFAILQGARDIPYDCGAGFFPAQIRSDLHEVRSTLEAYALKAVVAGRDDATACGLELSHWGVSVRVTSRGIRTLYVIDRWD